MTHTFFDNVSSGSAAALSLVSQKPRAYDLRIKPNSACAGLEAEMRDDGAVLAAKYPSGVMLRRNKECVVVQTPAALWFCDRWGGVHPLD